MFLFLLAAMFRLIYRCYSTIPGTEASAAYFDIERDAVVLPTTSLYIKRLGKNKTASMSVNASFRQGEIFRIIYIHIFFLSSLDLLKHYYYLQATDIFRVAFAKRQRRLIWKLNFQTIDTTQRAQRNK